VPLADGGSLDEIDVVTSKLPLNAWRRARIELDRGLSPSVRVFLDDIQIVDKPPITSNVHGTNGEADVGIIFVQPPSAPVAITFDDVLVRGL
jgi:hypothetical protein